MRKTKIVATVGPASFKEEVLSRMIENGLNVARFNFSHGTNEERKEQFALIKRLDERLKEPIGLMLDTKGPEIRVGSIQGGQVSLSDGDTLKITERDITGDADRISINYRGDLSQIEKGTKILLDDGLIELEVQKMGEEWLLCEVKNGGLLEENRGVNIPGHSLDLPSVTEQDKEDIKFGIKHGIHFISASFVRQAADVIEIKKLLREEWARDIKIIAKIENQEGVKNIDEIIEVSDGIMVARGDLGVELPTEQVPVIQRKIIKKCSDCGKPVIIATEMLDSMIRNPRPTRAEASDVASAVFDGADAVMLSGETAVGSYPVEAVKTMARIARETENSDSYRDKFRENKVEISSTITEAIGFASCKSAADLGAKAIVTPTGSGSTAIKVSQNRPLTPIIAVTPSGIVQHTLTLCWGVEPLLVGRSQSTDDMIDNAVDTALEAGLLSNGDLVTITAGVPVGIPGTTNLIKLDIVGEPLARGQGIGQGIISGKVRKVCNADEAISRVEEGNILITPMTNEQYGAALTRAGAIVTSEGGLSSHAAVLGLELDIPVIVNTGKIMDHIEDGDTVTVDGIRGYVYLGYVEVQ